MNPFLSIAIPSNNKSELLRMALDSVLSQAAGRTDIEVCISDNSANTQTKELVESNFLNHQHISYYRSIEYKSLDENVNRVVQVSRGEYVWLFGDDDIIVDFALPKIVECLRRLSPDILVLNSISFDAAGIIEDSRVLLPHSKFYEPENNDSFLEDFGGYLSYIGGIVIRRELWKKYFREELIGSYFAHIDVVCSAKVGRSAFYFAEPCIQMRVNSQTWSARHYEIWNLSYPNIIWGLLGYSEYAKLSVTPRILINSINSILSSRAYNRFSLQTFKETILASKDAEARTKVIGFIVALLPQTFFRLMYKLCIIAFNRKRTKRFSPKLALSQLKIRSHL